MALTYLSSEEMKAFKNYKHSADKTTLESFYCNVLLKPVE